MEVNVLGGFQYGGGFVLQKQNFLFCVAILQQEEVYISVFN
jgi:hypothetical protein